MVLQCNNVIVIGEQGIGPQLMTSAYFIVLFFLIQKVKVERKGLVAKPFIILLSVFCFYISINSLINKMGIEQIPNIGSLYIYLLATICLYNIRHSISDEQIWHIIKRLYIFLILVGVLQFLSTTQIIPKWLLSELLYNDSSEYVYFHFNYFYARVMSTFMEPSYFSGLLCGFIAILIYNKRKLKHANLYIMAGMVELVLTISTTAYLTFAVDLIVLVLIDKSKNKVKKYLPFAVLIFIFCFFTWDTLISDVIINKMESESGHGRRSWDLLALEEFLTHPIIGSGYITVRASTLLLMILANLGIVGLFFYFMAVFVGLSPIFNGKCKDMDYALSARLVLLSVVISQIIACPDIGLCTFWLSVYMVALTGGVSIRQHIQKL
jgi:hypothetical protein